MTTYDKGYWRSEVDKSYGLSQTEKERAKAALEEIELILGISTSSIDRKHPISKYVFLNTAPWTWRWLFEFVEAVRLMSQQTNGIKVINKLKNRATFDEALFQIYIAKCFAEGGLNIEFLEEDNKNRIVDWIITDITTKEKLLVELTELKFESKEAKDTLSEFLMIKKRLDKNCKSKKSKIPTLFYHGRLFDKIGSRPMLQDIFNKIDSTANEARRTGFAELIQNNTINLAIATNDKKDELKSWAVENNVTDRIEAYHNCSDSRFIGPSYRINDLKRIISKIKDKKGQFNRKTVNAVVIRADQLFLPTHIEVYIDILEQFLYNHKYLGILIVVGGHPGGPEINLIRKRNDFLYLIRSIDLITKEILILTNRYSMNKIKTLAFSTKIKTGFEKCETLLF